MHKRLISSVLWIFMCFWVGFKPLSAQDHATKYSEAEKEGYRLYASNCSLCHGADGNSVASVDLGAGKFRRASSDEELGRLINAGIPGTPMPPHKFDPIQLNGLVAYIRSMREYGGASVIGNADRGQALFEGKGACLSCHRVRGHGSRVAPDLSEIGSVRQPAALQESLQDPTASMLPMNRPVRAVTRDGKVIMGRRLNEDSYSVQLIDTEERLVSLIKADLKEYRVMRVSPMPSYRESFSSQEMVDVIAYLQTLKGLR